MVSLMAMVQLVTDVLLWREAARYCAAVKSKYDKQAMRSMSFLVLFCIPSLDILRQTHFYIDF